VGAAVVVPHGTPDAVVPGRIACDAFVREAVLLVGAVLVAGLLGPSWGAIELSRYGRTLVFAMGSDPVTLKPAVTTGVEAVAVGCKIFTRFGSTRCWRRPA
jgi:hypothetical protein